MAKLIILLVFFFTNIYADDACKYTHTFGEPTKKTLGLKLESICYKTHYILYSNKYKMPIIIEYKLNTSNINEIMSANKKIPRKKISFSYDDNYKIDSGKQYYPNDYKGTGIDRGHLVPYASAGIDKEDKININKMSNIAPQNLGLNRGCWKVHENSIRKRVINKKENLTITVGVGFKDKKKVEVINSLNYPSYFYMFIVNDTNKSKKIVFFDNIKAASGTCHNSEYLITETELEDIIQYNIYPLLTNK